MKLVLDTNVVISALGNERSPPGQILQLWQNSDVELLVSTATLAELAQVLTYPKIRKWLAYTDADIDEIVQLFQNETWLIEVTGDLPAVSPDPGDNIFLALAAVGQADYLVTGDKQHLLPLTHYQRTRIVSPITFLTLYSAAV